jgi:hypothetical protein
VTDAESPFVNVEVVVGMPTVLPEVVGAASLFTWPTMTAPLCPMPLLKNGAVGETEASSPHEIARTAGIPRSKPRSGVVVIESSGTKAGPQHPCLWTLVEISRVK